MEWFLIRDNDHLGPFTEDVLHQLYSNGEVEDDSLVWHEGWEDSKTYQEVFLTSHGETVSEFEPLADKADSIYDAVPAANIIKNDEVPPDLPPDLPPVPIDELKNEPVPVSKKDNVEDKSTTGENSEKFKNQINQIKEHVATAPKIESKPSIASKTIKKNPLAVKKRYTKKVIRKTKPLKEADQEVAINEVFNVEDDIAKQEKRLQKLLRISIIAGLTLLVCLPIFFYFTQDVVVFSRPSTMSLEDYERLVLNAKSESKDIQFAFSLASDKRTLWISTNVSLEGEVFINFKSQARRVLGDMRVEVKSRGILEKRLITLKEFQFVQGTRFVDGYYDAEIYTVNDLEEPFLSRFFEPREKQFRYLNSVLITSLHPIEFKKELARQQAKRNSNDRKFWEELKEEYRTVKGITEGIKVSLDKTFQATEDEWTNAISNFEKTYKTNYGVFFTSFVQSIEAKYDRISQQDFPDKIKILAEYKKLSELSKEIGEESMNVLENLKLTSIKEMTPEKFQDYKYNTLLKINLIISQCEKMIDEL